MHWCGNKRNNASSLTNERSGDCCCRDLIHQVDPEHSVAQKNANFEGYACACVGRQVEADNVHHHEEDAGDEKTHHI